MRTGLPQALRLIAVGVVLLTALLALPFVHPVKHRGRWLRACSQALLRAAGVRLRITPTSEAGGAVWGGVLVVANHLSWIDVLALAAVAPMRPLAKHEVARWPPIGRLARCAGALFVDRAGLRAVPATVAEITATLRGRDAVVVFPEGTTWCGAAAGPFRRAAFQAALDAQAPVRPVAITFWHADGAPARAAAFVGTQSLFDSILRVLRTPGMICEVTVLDDLAPTGDRRALARRAEAAIARATGVPHRARQPALVG
ncbi:MAG: 1-acyl-sn-glycerol-3-phosphate acyltransferase [Pseudonocardia sp.]|nr:1-acyl-sn-glycerol-3-phosphate acyltransferase [Pseudonocardia sp.]